MIKNRADLLSTDLAGDAFRSRKAVLDAVEAALRSADPAELVRRHLKIDNDDDGGDVLLVDGVRYELNEFRRIYVIGGGKASAAMAEAVSSLLGDRIDDGLVNVLPGTTSHFRTGKIRLNEASHPVPDERGVMGVKRMLQLVNEVTAKDLVICLISGGGSSLLPLPVEGITLEDLQRLTRDLLRCGAPIEEINTVRKHLSEVKGGRLAEKLYPAKVLSLILSDVVGGSIESIASGPASPDKSTYQEAVTILKKRRLWRSASPQIRRLLSEGAAGRVKETPKPEDPIFNNVRNLVIGGVEVACEAAEESLKDAGFNTLLLTTFLEGEARAVGSLLSTIAREISIFNRPVVKPAALIAGGETTVTVRGDGLGGRNQELALTFAVKTSGLRNIVLAALGTDGLDGNTDAAGAIVDERSLSKAGEERLDALAFLDKNDSYSFFSKIGGLIFTGATFTNVNDITIITIT